MAAHRKTPLFHTTALLMEDGRARKPRDFRVRQIVYSQGDPADALFYVVHGKVKLVVTSEQGKEAVVALAGPGELFGEICLVGPIRRATAVCMAATRLMRIEKAEMARALHADPSLAESFAYQLIARIGRIQADLADHVFSSSEKRLARALLSLANFEKKDSHDTYTTRIDQQTLAEMVGTTRPRISFFMNKFKKMGFVDYGGDLKIHRSLRNVIRPD